VIEVYAITDHPAAPLPDLAPLRAVATGELAAVCAPASEDAASPDELWRHEEIVEALMEDRDLLPVRYGTRFADDDAAAAALSRRHAELAAALGRVRGAVELSVRVLDTRPPADDERLRAKAAALRTVHEPLAALSRATTQRPAGDPSELLRAAYLVQRAAIEPFAARVAQLQAAHPDLRLLCTGPWPPYSFAEP
jgi:hypothetical protein